MEDFKTLLQSHPLTIPKEGDVVKCKIISIDKGEVHVDIEGLTVGVVRGRELFAESKEYTDLKVGNEVEATVLDLENENGEMELSFRIAGYQRAWNNVKKWMQDNITIKAKVLAANKGGLMMQVEGLGGFMPVSQLNPDHYPRVMGGDKNRILEKLRELMNKELEVKVIDVNEKEEKLIVSEKAVWEDTQKAVLESYKVGDTVEGEISALTSFGAFVKFGQDLEGLVHISEIAWQRIDHPKDILKVGDKVKAQIIQLDRSKIYLSIKRLVDDPWKSVKDKYKVGDKVEGKILKIEPFGLMVALDKDIHGLAHISELADEGISNLNEKFKIGQSTDFEIVSLEPPEHRLGLRLFGVKGKVKKTEEKKEEKDEKEVKKEKKKEEKEAK
ncbi:MAG: S1 RNA-binding domain-containing protein [Candidatus Magasanikbacteria bacterium]|nr:S1 RNA-binding domain-containing protein [Candidatus Magasanikbacteria bacterium]